MIELEDMFVRHRNPGMDTDLVIPVVLASPVPDSVMQDNVRANSVLDVPWLAESPPHDGIALVCGAGPSLADDIEDIRAKVAAGAKIFASNSAAPYLNKCNIPVAYQVVLDPHPVVADELGDAEEYLLASIIDPFIFSKYGNVTLWHPANEWIDDIIPRTDKNFCHIGGGVTVSNSSLCLAYTMGYRNIHVYGMDSSYRDDVTHVAPLPQVSQSIIITDVVSNGKVYRTSFDMKQQAIVFKELHALLVAEGCKVIVHGSGLLPDLFKSSAS